METLNKCILNYRQPKSAAFIEVVGEPERMGREKMWERPRVEEEEEEGKEDLEMGRRVQAEREHEREGERRRKRYLGDGENRSLLSEGQG